jgi:hypothetical protein
MMELWDLPIVCSIWRDQRRRSFVTQARFPARSDARMLIGSDV